MSPDKNRKRAQDLRWSAFLSILAGIVIIMVMGLFCFIFFTGDTSSQSGSYSSRRGLGFLLFGGVWGLWMIVRGVIYFIRALSGDEHYAKTVVDVMDKFESRHEAMMKKKAGNASMFNVLVLLIWVFLFLAVVGAIAVGYLFWARPR
jgi:nitrate reductase NapE component